MSATPAAAPQIRRGPGQARVIQLGEPSGGRQHVISLRSVTVLIGADAQEAFVLVAKPDRRRCGFRRT